MFSHPYWDAVSAVYKPFPQASPPSHCHITTLEGDGAGLIPHPKARAAPEDLSPWNMAEPISHGAQSHTVCPQGHSAAFGQSCPRSPQPSARELSTVPCPALLPSNSPDCRPFVMTESKLSSTLSHLPALYPPANFVLLQNWTPCRLLTPWRCPYSPPWLLWDLCLEFSFSIFCIHCLANFPFFKTHV